MNKLLCTLLNENTLKLTRVYCESITLNITGREILERTLDQLTYIIRYIITTMYSRMDPCG